MSELKVEVDGKEREIRGVSAETTCESIILVLAKATGKTGKVALLEKWRDFERILPSDECPLRSLQSWGCKREEVSLVLQDDCSTTSNHFNKSSINLSIGDKDGSIKNSVDCESQENITALQQRKLQRVARAIEILDLQFSSWYDNEEAFLYLTDEEIAQDLEVKLSKALKLQAKELVEFETWKNELQNLEQTHENLSRQREIFMNKIVDVEERIAEANDAIDMLLDDIEKAQNGDYELETSKSELTREELELVSKELAQQNTLFLKQDQELSSNKSSVSDLDSSIQSKNKKINQLKIEIELRNDDSQIAENFQPKTPEAEAKILDYHYNNNIGPSGSDMQSNIRLLGLKDQVEHKKIKSSSQLTESATKIVKHEDGVDINPTKKDEESYFESKPVSFQNTLQESISRNTPISSSKSRLENGLNEDNDRKRSKSAVKTTLPSLGISSKEPAQNVSSSLSTTNFTSPSQPAVTHSLTTSSENVPLYTTAPSTSSQVAFATSFSKSPDEDICDSWTKDGLVAQKPLTRIQENSAQYISSAPTLLTSSKAATRFSKSPDENISDSWTKDRFVAPKPLTRIQDHSAQDVSSASTLPTSSQDATRFSSSSSTIPGSSSAIFSPITTNANSSEYPMKNNSAQNTPLSPVRKMTLPNSSQNDSISPKPTPPPTHQKPLSRLSSESRPSKKESFKKIREVFEKEEGHSFSEMNKTSFEDNVRKPPKPATLPKPIRNHALPPQLGNPLLLLEEHLDYTNNSNSSTYSKPKNKVIVAPKPNGGLGVHSLHENSKLMKVSDKKSFGNFESISEYGNPRLMEEPCGISTRDMTIDKKFGSKHLSKPHEPNSAISTSTMMKNDLTLLAKPYLNHTTYFRSTVVQDNSEVLSRTDGNSSTTFDSTLLSQYTKQLAQPYRKHTSKSSTPLMASLSQSQSSRNHLSPPTATYNRKHSKNHSSMLNNGDTTEHGIFV